MDAGNASCDECSYSRQSMHPSMICPTLIKLSMSHCEPSLVGLPMVVPRAAKLCCQSVALLLSVAAVHMQGFALPQHSRVQAASHIFVQQTVLGSCVGLSLQTDTVYHERTMGTF